VGDAEEAPVVDLSQHPVVPIPDYQNGVPVLESLPGAEGVLYLDFDGERTTQWDGQLIVAKKPNLSAAQIRSIWGAVAEDYLPFTINVTTDLAVFERAAENSRIRCIITPTADAAPGAGGVAYVGSWNWTGDTPCWAFGSGIKEVAEQIAHEVGHTLGLVHDGLGSEEYYAGHGSGETGWAPIMGVAYDRAVSQWSKGEYDGASNREDDLRKITSNNTRVRYRTDDHPAPIRTASHLEVYEGGSATNRGIIERGTDVDTFRFTTRGGAVEVTAKPAGNSPNLALRLDLVGSADELLLTAAPAGTLLATLRTNLLAGEYAIKVRGAGRGADATAGFSAYGSLGYYQLTGVVAGAMVPLRLEVAENAEPGTLVGDLHACATGPKERVFTAAGGTGQGLFEVTAEGELRVAASAVLDFETCEQFDLLVDIRYPEDPASDETNRRVVVRVVDVNELPALASATFRVFEASRGGTILGDMRALDPDLYTRLQYGIEEGDEAGRFGVNGSGLLYLRRTLDASPGTIRLRVAAWDAGRPQLTNAVEVTVEVLPVPAGLEPGAIAYARYDGIPGTSLANLTNHPSFPRSPTRLETLPDAEIPRKTADLFGGVLRGYFLAPATGAFVFGVAGDRAFDLWLSTSEQPGDARRIAYANGSTAPRDWSEYGTQLSEAIPLVGGSACYLEARVKDGEGDEHLAVGWMCAEAGVATMEVIPGRYLAPYDIEVAPVVTNQTFRVHRDAFAGARFGRVQATDAWGTTAFEYSLAASTVPGLVAVDGATGWLRIADSGLLLATGATSLVFQTRVTGAGGVSSTGVMACALLQPDAVAGTQPLVEMFKYLGTGTTVASLTNHPKFPRRPDDVLPLSQFRIEPNSGETYGSRIRAIFSPPVSGVYRLCIASDDSSELWFSPSMKPALATPVASVKKAVGPLEWGREAGQKSGALALEAGSRYYLETRHKEGTGDDHLAVGWIMPGSTEPVVIPGSVLSPYDSSAAPLFSAPAGFVSASATNGAVVMQLSATDSVLDLLSWRITAGNEEGVFAVDPDAGTVRVADAGVLGTSNREGWALTVEVQDSGTGDWVPRRVASAVVNITRVPAPTPYELWAQSEGISPLDLGGDPEGDGVSNLLEFAFGGDPLRADGELTAPMILLAGEGSSTHVRLRFRRRVDPAASGLEYTIQTADHLESGFWELEPAALDGVPRSLAPEAPAYEEATYRVLAPVPLDVGPRFFRVRVDWDHPAADGP